MSFSVNDNAALRQTLSNELQRILQWWGKFMPDEDCGGFIGEMSHDNIPQLQADKGIILNTRILWFFSEAAYFLKDEQAVKFAQRAYNYLLKYFEDAAHGGFFWRLNHKGQVVDNKKQSYAQAFALYGIASYYRIKPDSEVLKKAYALFDLIEKRCHDNNQGGYLEAFTADWYEIDDMRLSNKDANFPKTMNTHLHVLEAYTNLQAIAPRADVAQALRRCIGYFNEYFVDKNTWHLRMFLDKEWRDHSTAYSYGHDIEYSWLLYKALKTLDDARLTEVLLPQVEMIAATCLQEGLTSSGKVLDEFHFATQTKHNESCWWTQAEALVGFLYAFTLKGDKKYFSAFESVWDFIQREHIDHKNGEWHWFCLSDQGPNYREYKAGFWKAPYHNGRAMMETIKLIDAMQP